MALRSLVLTARFVALAGMIMGRGRRRVAAWAIHDFLWLFPTLKRNCSWHGPVVTRFDTSRREVWLTIDDGPDPADTPALLDVLRHYGAKATFFVIGEKVNRHPELVRRIVADGHTLGNHSYSHPRFWWWLLPRPSIRREIALGNESIVAATGRAPSVFRSPVGMNNLSVHPIAHSAGLQVIGWSADACDGCGGVPHQVAASILKKVRPGGIILLHESGGAPRRRLTLDRVLERLSAEGYRCVVPEPFLQ